MLDVIRSFIAAEISDPRIRQRITEIQNIIRDTRADLRLVQPENIHATIRFLGEISQSVIEQIKDEMALVKFGNFQVTLLGIGAFPNSHRPNVVWVGISQGAEQLKDIHAQLEPRLRAIGIAPDNKGFNPHITIARVKSPKNRDELARTVTEMENTEVGTVNVHKIDLKRSVLTPRGPIYSTIFEKNAESNT